MHMTIQQQKMILSLKETFSQTRCVTNEMGILIMYKMWGGGDFGIVLFFFPLTKPE